MVDIGRRTGPRRYRALGRKLYDRGSIYIEDYGASLKPRDVAVTADTPGL
jgi:hypothetical protein